MQHKFTEQSKTVSEILAKIIKEERLKLEKSQRTFADEYELQRSMISRIENGKNNALFISVLALCETLEMKFSDFAIKFESMLPENFTFIDK